MKGRWLLVGLVVSLALNLFLVGLGVGALVLGGGARRGPDAQVAAGPRRAPLWMAGRGLSPAHRPGYREVLMRATRQARPDLLEARRLKRQAFDAMAATPYDAEAVAADLAQARSLEFKARTRVEKDIATFAATLPPDERAALSESLRAVMTRPAAGRLQRNVRPEGPGAQGRAPPE